MSEKNIFEGIGETVELEIEDTDALKELFNKTKEESLKIKKRFVDGTYTEDDLLNRVPRFGFGTKDKIEMYVVESKYFEDLVNRYTNLKEAEKVHQEENGKLRVELEQVERKVEKYRIGWCNTGGELEQEKLKNKDMKSAVEYLKKVEPEKLKIIADSWNDKVAHKFDTEIKELTQKAFEDGQESIVKRYISKDKIKDMMKYREFELQQKYKDFEEDVEWRTYKKILGGE